MSAPTPPPVPPPKRLPTALAITAPPPISSHAEHSLAALTKPEFQIGRESMRQRYATPDSGREVLIFLGQMGLALCGIGWFCTFSLGHEFPGQWALHLFFLSVTCGWLANHVGRCWFRLGNGSAPAFVAAAIAAAILLTVRLETFERSEHWKTTDGDDAWTQHTYSRWDSSKPLFEETTMTDIQNGDEFWRRGPLAGESKRHGEWKIGSHGKHFRDWISQRHWYWYGEEVSEGRWHELSRQ